MNPTKTNMKKHIIPNRRAFLSKALALGTLSNISLSQIALGKNLERRPHSNPHLKIPLPSLKDRNVLFTWGGWARHEPQKFVEFLTPWLEAKGAKVNVYNTLDPYTDKTLMQSVDLILQTFTMSEITKEQEKGILEAVKNGTGMAGWHGGMCDAFRKNTEYQFMTGGQWVAHPGGILPYEVNIVDGEDLLTNGLDDFRMESEQYYMHVDPNIKVLATTTFTSKHVDWIAGCVIPVIWKKMYGKGRIFYTSLGHNLNHITEVPEAFEILKRGIQWASASKYEPPEKWISPLYRNI